MSEEKTIWITGADGFVGSELVTRLGAEGYSVIGTGEELSVCEPGRLEVFAVETHPDVIVNCAAIRRSATTLGSRVKAYEVNALGAHNVAVVANAIDALMVQVSSDDVYPVRMSEPANEFDTPHPETPYGKSKRAGETMVQDAGADNLIVRSQWICSVNGGQVKEALDAAAAGETIVARTDQYASPTTISTYAHFLSRAIERHATGYLHIVSRGVASRYDLLKLVLETCGYDPGKVLVPKSDLVTAEQVLLESLMIEMYGVEMPMWEDAVRDYLEEVGYAK